jgi:hypothetical protein
LLEERKLNEVPLESDTDSPISTIAIKTIKVGLQMTKKYP